jgi:hypothetical protein
VSCQKPDFTNQRCGRLGLVHWFKYPTQNRSQRKDILSKLVGTGVLSDASRVALINATDPFHDYEEDCKGLPDENSNPSIVRCVKKSLQIQVPETFTANENFDVHIYNLPERQSFIAGQGATGVSCDVVTMDGSGTISGSGPLQQLPFNVVYATSGSSTTPAGPGFNLANLAFDGIDYDDYFFGQSRIIGIGMEVHNTTADLYKSGTATLYRLPQSTVDADFVHANGTSVQSHVAGKISRLPPGNTEQALLLRGSLQWEAKDGSYQVPVFEMDDNKPITSLIAERAFFFGDFSGSSSGGGDDWENPTETGYLARQAYEYSGVTQTYGIPIKPIPCDTCGVIFTGLNYNTTMTLVVKVYVETFPTYADPLVTLARAPPPYDPMFFKLYKDISLTLPAGCKVNDNAKGKFWAGILDVIGTVAPMIGSLGGPLGSVIGGAVGNLAKKGANMVRDKKEAEKLSKELELGLKQVPGDNAKLRQQNRRDFMNKEIQAMSNKLAEYKVAEKVKKERAAKKAVEKPQKQEKKIPKNKNAKALKIALKNLANKDARRKEAVL